MPHHRAPPRHVMARQEEVGAVVGRQRKAKSAVVAGQRWPVGELGWIARWVAELNKKFVGGVFLFFFDLPNF